MNENTFTMKVNYVKVVDELLRKRYKVILQRSNPLIEKTFDDIVKEVMRRHMRPYTTSKEDKECFAREMKDRSDYNEGYNKRY